MSSFIFFPSRTIKSQACTQTIPVYSRHRGTLDFAAGLLIFRSLACHLCHASSQKIAKSWEKKEDLTFISRISLITSHHPLCGLLQMQSHFQ